MKLINGMIYLLCICNGSIVGGILLVAGLYSVLWGKNKENKTLQCNKVNTMDIGMPDEQEHGQREEDKKGREEQKEATSAFMVEQV